MNYIPVVTTLVTFLFTALVLRRYQARGGTHLLLWGVGLVFYGLGTLSEVILSITFNPWVLKLWYLTGAMLTAAWLGQGTVHLLVRRRRVASRMTIGLGAVSLLAAVLIFIAPLSAAAASYNPAQPASSQYEEILIRSGLVFFLTILLNIYGTITLVGGAIYSAVLFWRKRVLSNRMYGNILIAAGAMSPALGGTFIRLGLNDWLYLSELVGAVVMFAGFLVATAEVPAQLPEAEPLASGDL